MPDAAGLSWDYADVPPVTGATPVPPLFLRKDPVIRRVDRYQSEARAVRSARLKATAPVRMRTPLVSRADHERNTENYLAGACRHKNAWKTRASKSAVASSKALPTQFGGSFLDT